MFGGEDLSRHDDLLPEEVREGMRSRTRERKERTMIYLEQIHEQIKEFGKAYIWNDMVIPVDHTCPIAPTEVEGPYPLGALRFVNRLRDGTTAVADFRQDTVIIDLREVTVVKTDLDLGWLKTHGEGPGEAEKPDNQNSPLWRVDTLIHPSGRAFMVLVEQKDQKTADTWWQKNIAKYCNNLTKETVLLLGRKVRLQPIN